MGIKQVIVWRKDLKVRKGKFAAQVAHASMKFLLAGLDCSRWNDCHISDMFNNDQIKWMYEESFTKIVAGCKDKDELEQIESQAREAGLEVHRIVDNGATEFAGVPTLTCIAIGPSTAEEIDKITGHLELM